MTDYITALITGADGFIGRHLLQRASSDNWSQDLNLVPWSRSVEGDVLDPEVFESVIESVDPEALIHLAWLRTGRANYETDPANEIWANATIAIIDQCERNGLWFIGVGTGLETDAKADETPYLVAKQRIYRRLQSATPALTWTWLRPHWVFCAEEHRPRVVRAAFEQVSRGEVFTPASPESNLDFVHVIDVVDGILYVLHNGLLGVQDLASGETRTVAELLATLGYPCTSVTDRDSKRPNSDASLERLIALGWKPQETTRLFMEPGDKSYGNATATSP